MGLNFVDRIIKSTLIAAAITFPFLALYINTRFGLSVLFGAIWGSLNLLAIKIVITSLVTKQSRRTTLGIIVLVIKLPILYGIGYLLVTWKYMSVPGLLWGFSGIFITALLNALSRSILKLDRKISAGGTTA